VSPAGPTDAADGGLGDRDATAPDPGGADRLVVRIATPDDALVLADLNRGRQQENHRRVPEWFPAPGDPDVADLMRGWLAREGAIGFVAELDGRLAGYALAGVHHRPATKLTPAERWIDLDQIAVAPEARRRGVARALCEEVIAHARALGLEGVQLNVWAFNPEAQALFTSLGFDPLSMRLALTHAGDGEVGGAKP
jgi:ribosomal protein S18 acetylase RimI-like enzyme